MTFNAVVSINGFLFFIVYVRWRDFLTLVIHLVQLISRCLVLPTMVFFSNILTNGTACCRNKVVLIGWGEEGVMLLGK